MACSHLAGLLTMLLLDVIFMLCVCNKLPSLLVGRQREWDTTHGGHLVCAGNVQSACL